jgi:hypothetical protein
VKTLRSLLKNRRVRRNRPVLRPGEQVTFYDPTGTIPMSTMIIESYSETLNEGRTLHMVGLEEYLQGVRL